MARLSLIEQSTLVDAKRRVIIPRAYREQYGADLQFVPRQNGDAVLWQVGRLARLEDALARRSLWTPAGEIATGDLMWAMREPVEIDAAGRLRLPSIPFYENWGFGGRRITATFKPRNSASYHILFSTESSQR